MPSTLPAATRTRRRTGTTATSRSTTGATTASSSRSAARSRWATGTAPTSPSTTGSRETFPVCDRWFCSTLAQTYPNRRFLIAGTAAGIVSTTDRGAVGAAAAQRHDLRAAHRARHHLAQLLQRPARRSRSCRRPSPAPTATGSSKAEPVHHRRRGGQAPRRVVRRPELRARSRRRTRRTSARASASRRRSSTRRCRARRGAKTLLHLVLRRARRLLRPRPAAARDPARQHPARHPRPATARRVRPVRVPRPGRDRVAVRASRLRVARRARPHVGAEADRDEVEPARADLPRRQRRQPARLARPRRTPAFIEPPELPAPALPASVEVADDAEATDHCVEGEPGGPIPPPAAVVPASAAGNLRVGAT